MTTIPSIIRRYVAPVLSSRKRKIPFLGCSRYISSLVEEGYERPISYKKLFREDPQSRCLDRSSPETKMVEKIFERILVALYKSLKIEGRISVNGKEIKLSTSSIGNQGGLESSSGGCEFEYLRGMSWKIDVVDSYMGSMSWGSHIFISSRDISANKSEADLACVIGHEAAHTIAKHTCRPGFYLLYQLYKEEVLFISKISEECFKYWSRRHALEAEHLGLIFAALAGYDPRSRIKRLHIAASFDDEQDIFSLHPSFRRRSEFLSRPQIVENVVKLYEEAAKKL